MIKNINTVEYKGCKYRVLVEYDPGLHESVAYTLGGVSDINGNAIDIESIARRKHISLDINSFDQGFNLGAYLAWNQ